jgi:hypothetical protein
MFEQVTQSDNVFHSARYQFSGVLIISLGSQRRIAQYYLPTHQGTILPINYSVTLTFLTRP